MTEIFIILGLTFFALLAIIRRDLALYLIIFLLPTYQIRFQVGSIPATFLEGMILILALVVIVVTVAEVFRPPEADKSADYSGNLKVSVTNIFILLFLLAATISIFVSPVPIKAAGIWKAFFVEAVMFGLLVLAMIDSKEKLKNLFLALAGLTFYLSVFGIYQFLTLENLPFSWWAVEVESRRIISLVNHPNALALLLGPMLALLIFLRDKTKFHWAAIILGSAALYLSFSRAAWLAVIATILIFEFVVAPFMEPAPPQGSAAGPDKSGNYKFKGALLLLLTVSVVIAIPFSRQKLIELTNQSDASRQNRIVLWTAASEIIKKHPLTGVGLAGFHEEYKNYPLGPDRVVQNYPHNFFLNFWVETGLIGLLAITALMVLFYKQKPPLPIMAAMTVVLLHGMVDVPYFKNDLSVLFWTIYALGFIKIRRSGSSPVLSDATSDKLEISA